MSDESLFLRNPTTNFVHLWISGALWLVVGRGYSGRSGYSPVWKKIEKI